MPRSTKVRQYLSPLPPKPFRVVLRTAFGHNGGGRTRLYVSSSPEHSVFLPKGALEEGVRYVDLVHPEIVWGTAEDFFADLCRIARAELFVQGIVQEVIAEDRPPTAGLPEKGIAANGLDRANLWQRDAIVQRSTAGRCQTARCRRELCWNWVTHPRA
jgi:hypothetical protein